MGGKISLSGYMKKSEYADYRGISRAAISKHVKNGGVVITEDGLIDVELSDFLLDQCSERVVQAATNPTVPKSPRQILSSDEIDSETKSILDRLSETPAGSYAEQRTLLTQYKASLAKIDLDERESKLVDAELMYDSAFKSYRKLRDALYGMSDRQSGPLAAETGPRGIAKILNDEINGLLQDLIDELQQQFSRPLSDTEN